MSPTHPPTLITLVRRSLEKSRALYEGSHVLVAVSGGPDSMALMHTLARFRKVLDIRLSAHGIDHGLRPEAGAELDLAEQFAQTLAVPFGRTRVTIAPGGNLQARARDARHEALRKAVDRTGANLIALGHHADDRAETVLLRLLRGAGPRGLAVLPPRAGLLVRPMIDARRSAIAAHLSRHAIPFASDPSNANMRFLRGRVRHELLPLLTQLDANVVEHLCALADRLRGAASAQAGSNGLEDIEDIARLPGATQLALLSLRQTRSPKARVALPKGLVASYDRAHDSVTVQADPTPEWRLKTTPCRT